MSIQEWILAGDFLASFLVDAALVLLLLYVSYKNKLFDMPDYRKVHEIPVPRLGGLSFLPTVLTVCLVSFALLYSAGVLSPDFTRNRFVIRLACLFAGCFIVYLAGLVDDFSGLDYRVKFVAQLLAAIILVSSGLWFHSLFGLFGIWEIPAALGKPLTVLFIVLLINSMNLIDGIDGLSAGLSLMALGMLSYIFLHLRSFIACMVSVSAFGTLAAFFLFNVFGKEEKHTKIFMGDTGSMTVGLILSYLIITLSYMNNGPVYEENRIILMPVLSALMIPMLEVLRLFFLRLSRHKSPFKPDSNHIHHRLLHLGLDNRRVLAVLLAFAVVLTGVSVLMVKWANVTVILGVEAALFFGFHALISALSREKAG